MNAEQFTELLEAIREINSTISSVGLTLALMAVSLLLAIGRRK